ncbi:extracellular serine proteinase-like [Diadema setosum]|uniref:extracellular serine proteinase-like n=1 Tax=Diadema setosum TaxID=31175 RepID=UPI003B3AFF45
MEEVSYIEENGLVKSNFVPGSWGIDRVDQRYLPLDGQAEFTGDGSGVSVYVLDTGIYPDNIYFAGRAQVGYDAVGGGQHGIDCDGHGTHCAGTVGANSYGIAHGAALYGVRVLNCLGSGTNAQVIDGVDWVAANAIKPAVASMSLGGGVSNALDAAVASLVNTGVPVSVSAGNNDADACDASPARSPRAITVGATDSGDKRGSFSAYGTCVDIFAPGVDITSTWYTGVSAINTISGTSMACPHVTGALAIALGNDGSLTPEELRTKIIDDSTKNVVEDPEEGSPNRLLYIP